MATATATLKMLLLAEDKASAAFKRLGGTVDETGKKHLSYKKAAQASMIAVAGAATAFGASSISKFKEVGAETLGLMRVMGGTSETASRLRFAASQTGVSYETLAKSSGKLSKALVASEGSAKANAAMIKTLGFNYRDAHGQILPMDDLIPKIADKFAKMPAGAEKTALAMKLFGKAGADMLPFLNKGKDGIAGLEKESDKFGLTLSGKNIDALKKSKMSQREWNASMLGLKVVVGEQLLPIMNNLVGFIRDKVIPVIEKITAFIKAHKDVVLIAVSVIGTLIVGMKALAIATGILNAVMDANPIALIVIAIAALAAGLYMAYKRSETFRDIVQAAFTVVKAVIMTAIIRPMQMVIAVIGEVISFVRAHWQLLLGILTGPIGAAIIVIVRHFSSIKAGFAAVVNFIRTLVGQIVGFFAGIPGAIGALAGRMASAGKNLMVSWWNGFKSAAGAAAGFVGNVVGNIASGIKNAINSILNLPWHIPEFKIGAFGHYVHVGGQTIFPRLYEGGMVTGPGAFVLGDNPSGREVALPLDSPGTTRALGAALGAAGAGSSGGDLNVYLTMPPGLVIGSPAQLAVVVKRAVEEGARQGVRFNFGKAITAV